MISSQQPGPACSNWHVHESASVVTDVSSLHPSAPHHNAAVYGHVKSITKFQASSPARLAATRPVPLLPRMIRVSSQPPGLPHHNQKEHTLPEGEKISSQPPARLTPTLRVVQTQFLKPFTASIPAPLAATRHEIQPLTVEQASTKPGFRPLSPQGLILAAMSVRVLKFQACRPTMLAGRSIQREQSQDTRFKPAARPCSPEADGAIAFVACQVISSQQHEASPIGTRREAQMSVAWFQASVP
jgi:hypothetical protein